MVEHRLRESRASQVLPRWLSPDPSLRVFPRRSARRSVRRPGEARQLSRLGFFGKSLGRFLTKAGRSDCQAQHALARSSAESTHPHRRFTGAWPGASLRGFLRDRHGRSRQLTRSMGARPRSSTRRARCTPSNYVAILHCQSTFRPRRRSRSVRRSHPYIRIQFATNRRARIDALFSTPGGPCAKGRRLRPAPRGPKGMLETCARQVASVG